jgi:CBS domain-containing protein
MKPISDLMQRGVRTVAMDTPIAEVERIFTTNDLSWAPVLEGGEVPLGVISATDLLVFEATGRDRTGTKAWQLCTYRPLTVSPSTPAAEVARLMVQRRVHHVVVLENARVVGVVSSLDFVSAFADCDGAQA